MARSRSPSLTLPSRVPPKAIGIVPSDFPRYDHAPRQMRICLDTKTAHSGNLGQRDCRKLGASDQHRVTIVAAAAIES
jgi:hypothetical protein